MVTRTTDIKSLLISFVDISEYVIIKLASVI